MKKYLLSAFLLTFVGLLMFGIPSGEVWADGNETKGLGPPNIAIASGSGIVSAGTGLAQGATAAISVEVPAGAKVNQVLLYWYGRGTPDDTLLVAGTSVLGDNIGENNSGRGLPGGASTTFRADITGLGLVSAGLNSLEVGGWDFTFDEGGAGVVVIFENASGTSSDLQIVDGHDFAADDQGFDGTDLEFAFPRKFTFEPAAVDRMATVDLFVANGDGRRPDAVEITVGGTVTQTGFEDITVPGQGFIGGTSFDSDGFLFSASELFVIGEDATVCGGANNDTACADSGSQTLVSLGPAVTIAEASGGTFSLRRLDVAEGIVNFSVPPATAFSITGTLAGGGTVSAGPFDLDEVIDGAGANDFRTYTLPPSFAQAVLTSATIVSSEPAGGAFSIDNIVLATPGGDFIRVEDVVDATDGLRWDTLKFPAILIPGGETMLTAQVISRDPDPSVPSPNGPTPDSIAWVAATLTLPPPPEECVGEIGDYVWLDDGDGCQEDDAGIDGVEVCIYAGCSNTEVPIDCTTTKNGGFYLFTGLECGRDYEIKFTRPDGFVETEANSCPDPDNNDDTKDSDCVEGERVCVSLGEDTIVQDLTIDCGYVPECDIEVTKTCEVLESEPVDGDVCDVLGKPVALNFNYNPGTTVTTGQDSGKAEILFDSGAVDNDGVSFIIATDKSNAADALDGAGKRFFQGNVAFNALFEVNEDIDDFGSTTYIHFFDDSSGGLLQSIEYHTSCSQPIQLGDVIGNATLVEYKGENGSASAEPPELGAEECTIQSEIADCKSIEALTGSKPDVLTWQYTGGGCGASDNSQDSGDLFCTGSIDGSQPVMITDDDGNVFEVMPGGVFTTTRSASKEFTLTNARGTEFNGRHVSCSQPLITGDVYGSLTLAALEGIGIGAEVRYLYKVTNNNAVETIWDIAVKDDPLAPAPDGVPGSPIDFLLPGESQTLELTTFISQTTENTVTVNGKVDDLPICEDSDTVKVTVLPPPPCEVTIVFDKLEDDKLKFKLTNTDVRVATLDILTVNFPPEYGLIKEVKLDGGIFKKGDSDDFPNGVPSGTTIGPNDWTEDDVTKRQLDPGETRKLEVVFTEKSKGEGWVDINTAGTAAFEEGCSVELIKPSGCEIGKPTALEMIYTGEDCSASDNTQDPGKVSCSGDPNDAAPVQVVMTKDADKFTVTPAGETIGLNSAFEIRKTDGGDFPSEIKFDFRRNGATLQSLRFHTSCSQPLIVGDQFGSVIVTEFFPEP